MMSRAQRYLWIALPLLGMLGCQTKPVTPPQLPTSIEKVADIPVEAPYTFNKRFGKLISNHDFSAVQALISDAALQQWLQQKSANTTLKAAELKSSLIAVLKLLETVSELDYLSTDELGNGYWASHYHVQLSDEQAIYLTFTFADRGEQLVDIHSHVYQLSTSDYLIAAEALAKMPMQQQLQWRSLIKPLANNQFAEAAQAYQVLPIELKQQVIIQEYIARMLSAADEERAKPLLELMLNDSHRLPSLFWIARAAEHENCHSVQAMWSVLPEFVQQDSLMLFMQGRCHYQLQQTQAMWQVTQQLLYRHSDQPVAYLYAVQLALLAGEFQHAVAMLSAFELRFDGNVGTEALRELENGAAFLASTEYAQWRKL